MQQQQQQSESTLQSQDIDPYKQLIGITLVPRGFLIPKRKENSWLLQRAIRELTFQKPEKRYGSRYAKKEPPTCVYIRSEQYMLVPKFWLLPIIRGKSVAVHMANEDGEPIDIHYRDDMSLYEDRRRPQRSALEYALKHLRATGGALLEMPVGTGKTNVGLKAMAECGVKTLWLCHRHSLIQQAAERAREFIPGIRVGWLHGDVFDIADKDIVFGTIQSVGQKITYSPEIFRQFGMLVLDEAHHAPAAIYKQALFRSACPRMLALTANPQRSDGMEDITYFFFSHNKFVVEPTLPDGIELHIRTFRFHQRSFLLEPDLCDSVFRKRRQRSLATLAASNCCTIAEAERLQSLKLDQQPDDLSEGGYSVLCSGIGRIAPLNAFSVALIKKALVTPNAEQFGDVSLDEMRDTEFAALQDRERSNVAVLMTDTGERIPIDQLTKEVEIVCDDGTVRTEIVYDKERERRCMQQCERQVFVAFFHKALVDHFYRRLQRSGVPQHMIGRYYGECNDEERVTSLQKRIVLLTYAMAEEGLDVCTANTLGVVSPRGASSLQCIGRVLRDKMTRMIMPLVFHFHHQWCDLESGMYWKRGKQFRRYPYRERIVDVGQRRIVSRASKKKRKAATQKTTMLDFVTRVPAPSDVVTLESVEKRVEKSGGSNETQSIAVERSSGEVDTGEFRQSATDLRVNECGAVSVRREPVAKRKASQRKVMSASEKRQRKSDRDQARAERQQSDLQSLVDGAQCSSVQAEAVAEK